MSSTAEVCPQGSPRLSERLPPLRVIVGKTSVFWTHCLLRAPGNVRRPGQGAVGQWLSATNHPQALCPWEGGPPTCKVMLGTTLQQAAQNRAEAGNARKVGDTLSQEWSHTLLQGLHRKHKAGSSICAPADLTDLFSTRKLGVPKPSAGYMRICTDPRGKQACTRDRSTADTSQEASHLALRHQYLVAKKQPL